MSSRYEIITTTEQSNDKTGRLTPIGSESSPTRSQENFELIEEHEKLTTSLAALTRHIAHVQLRLQQVVSAPTAEDRENLLFKLYEFASDGLPDIIYQTSMHCDIEIEKCREKKFINELKQKLDELEHYAAASGLLDHAPTSVIIEKQRILIQQLQSKLDLQFDEDSVSKLSSEELRKLVDQAINQLTTPVKLKENLITQMRTEINDLEKFVEFLKMDSTNPSDIHEPIESPPISKSNQTVLSRTKSQHSSSTLSQTIKKFLLLTQLYTFLLLSCGTKSMQKTSYIKKNFISQKHFGDLRAKLEIAIEQVLRTIRLFSINNDLEQKIQDPVPITVSVRQDFIPALRALLEHGLYETIYSTSFDNWNCCSKKTMRNSVERDESMHIWKLFLKYYQLKEGDEFANSPAHKLSQAYSLDIIGGQPVTIKQHLLSIIDTVIKLNENHPRPMDSCFKSFICYALNEKKLVSFLRIIFQTTLLIDHYYHSWSYIKQTGFNDALHSLDRFTLINFQLPIDRSIRRFLINQDLIE